MRSHKSDLIRFIGYGVETGSKEGIDGSVQTNDTEPKLQSVWELLLAICIMT